MSSTQGPHSLAFRVMRLCRPSFHIDNTPLRFDPADFLVGEDTFDDPIAASQLPSLLNSLSPAASKSADSDLTYRSRFLLRDSSDAIGLSGLLVLPQSFGAIYLGETFCSYVSINNSSKFEVKDVVIKAEIQTDRQRILLLDTTKSPVESIRAGGRYDFIVEHDVKELGAHTLVCTAQYHDGDADRKYLPQFFKFIVANPLSVRTKVRIVKGITFLETCIENHTKLNLYMDQVEFEPSQNWSAVMLKADKHTSENSSLTREIFKSPVLIRSGGGIHNYLYQLKNSSNESAQTKVDGSNILGKLQITWRTNLGEPGRLQTQQILGSSILNKEIELQIVELPSATVLERPFLVHLKLTNHTDRETGPFEVLMSQSDSLEEKVVMVTGLQTMTLPKIEAFDSNDFQLGYQVINYQSSLNESRGVAFLKITDLNLIATKLGVQKITGITVFDMTEKKTHDPLPDLEIFVDSDCSVG